MNLQDLINRWENSALNFSEAETLINLLITDNKRLENENREKEKKPDYKTYVLTHHHHEGTDIYPFKTAVDRGNWPSIQKMAEIFNIGGYCLDETERIYFDEIVEDLHILDADFKLVPPKSPVEPFPYNETNTGWNSKQICDAIFNANLTKYFIRENFILVKTDEPWRGEYHFTQKGYDAIIMYVSEIWKEDTANNGKN